LVWGGEPVSTTLMQAPLFPGFISIVYRLSGPSLLAVRAAHALMGTMTCAFTVVVTRRLFRSSTAGIIAGLMMALYLPAIFYEGVLVPATLILFLDSLFVFLMVPEKGPPQGVRLVLSGFVLGLSVIAKPVAVLLVPFALLFILRGAPGRAFARNAAVFIVGLLVAMTPLTIRNAKVTGEFIPLTTGGGINFYIGNNPKANGFYSVPFYEGSPIGGTPEVQQRRMTDIAEKESGRPLSGREVSSFWTRKGLDHIRRFPRRSASLLWQKTLFFWNSYERSNVESLAFHRRFGGILPLRLPGFGFVAPLGLLGIFMTWKDRRRLHLIYGGIITYFTAGLVFYVLARYRLPVIVFLIPMAGAAVASMLKLFR
ncbi:MAG TPA: glycosyltransferase family 39 protein, partial [Candidatus Krumholzibacterium sp.]|nr:glycosyltransferase family 39 protein [Candidatus Krumholzibacterium sp.]